VRFIYLHHRSQASTTYRLADISRHRQSIAGSVGGSRLPEPTTLSVAISMTSQLLPL
jgi:hypothetical protein